MSQKPAGRSKPAFTRWVFIRTERAYCPACDSENVAGYKSLPREDDTVRRYARCRDCGEKFYLVVEFADSCFRKTDSDGA